jgi:hypothetical protein
MKRKWPYVQDFIAYVEEVETLDTYIIFSIDSPFHIFRAVNKHNGSVRSKYFYTVREKII